MTTIIHAALLAMRTALDQAPAVAPLVDLGRKRPIAQETAQAVVLRPVQSEVVNADMRGIPSLWRATLAVECYARAGSGWDGVAPVESLTEAVYERLMADPTLGGAVVALEPNGAGYDFDADGQLTTCATLVFNALLRTAGTTLT